MNLERRPGWGHTVFALFLAVVAGRVASLCAGASLDPWASPVLHWLSVTGAWAFGLASLALVIYALGVARVILGHMNAGMVIDLAEAKKAKTEALRVETEFNYWKADVVVGNVKAGASDFPIHHRGSLRLMEQVQWFAAQAWRITLGEGYDPARRAQGIARQHWCDENDGPDTARRQWHSLIVSLLEHPLAVVVDRKQGRPGRFVSDSLDEVLQLIADRWEYVKIDEEMVKKLGPSQPSQVAQLGVGT